jgi:hypothetical protein
MKLLKWSLALSVIGGVLAVITAIVQALTH